MTSDYALEAAVAAKRFALLKCSASARFSYSSLPNSEQAMMSCWISEVPSYISVIFASR